MKIIVLAGGLSPERDVSLSSGALIANALMAKGHDVMLLDLYLGINNTQIEPVYVNRQSNKTFSYLVPEQEPDLVTIKLSVDNQGSLIGAGVIDLCKQADVVFLALHGSIGENGQLQALLDIKGIKYTGTDYVGSLLAMDKDLSKRLMFSNNVLTPKWKYVDLYKKINLDDIGFPCVVKPANCGSSVGVSIVDTPTQLRPALNLAKKYDNFALIEEKIVGREFSVGILNGKALPVIEIKPRLGFYDYKNKYQKGLTKEICPAKISDEICALLQNNALKAHKILRLGFYSRIDFLLDQNNQAYCLEANTLPGMTPTSLLPQEALASGISYDDLCEKIALAAFAK
ncbi:MAG: D-alanine--D-alanine ligase [Candidatus Pacebacteria bacterium]|nr:D-alanine--D-alanine ligase [Candidatus Paceibacterota bacterium]